MVTHLDWVSLVQYTVIGLLLLRTILSFKSILYIISQSWRWLGEKAQVYQYYEIPQFSETCNGTENPLYRKASLYVSSLASLEDSAMASLVASPVRMPSDFLLPIQLGPAQMAHDSFHGARVSWTYLTDGGPAPAPVTSRLVLRIRRQDRTRVLRPYIQHVESIFDDIEVRRRNLRLFTNSSSGVNCKEQVWRSVPFTHPATLDTVAMDPELKSRICADLESFLNGRNYYRNLGRVWKRSFLLHGASGTGKSTFSAAMARFLGYDVYDFDLTGISRHELRTLLAKTTPKSVILVEDLDRHLSEGNVNLSEMLNFMDGIFSCCGEERIMVFTMSSDAKEGNIDPALLRPGRLDIHVHFPMCDFSGFKTLAGNFLGIKDHKLYPQVEEEFQGGGARLSPAEVGEIMISSRGSPSRAIKSLISVLKARNEVVLSREDERFGAESGRLNFGVKSKKFYGLIKVMSRREGLPTEPHQEAGTPVSARRGGD
ncbi:hypothetical protein LUZ60_016446 [Juncus effusus]|nr:hypothetical protein LUZ60_016446 [Juncus effusus]